MCIRDRVEDDASDNIDNALTIPIETEIQKSFIGKYDIDFLKFTIPTTGTYDIEITTQDPIAVSYTHLRRCACRDKGRACKPQL